MAPLRKLLLVGGLAASLLTGCAASEEPQKGNYVPSTFIHATFEYPDCSSNQEESTDAGTPDAESTESKSGNHYNPQEDSIRFQDYGHQVIDQQPYFEVRTFETCLAKIGDDEVNYFQPLDSECKYGYLRMDEDARFVLACKEDCPLPNEFLDQKFDRIVNTFDAEETFYGEMPDYAKPIEIHLTLDQFCGHNHDVSPYFTTIDGRDMICDPVYEMTQGEVQRTFPDEDFSVEELHERTIQRLNQRLSEMTHDKDTIVGHELFHATTDKVYTTPYMWDQMGARLTEQLLANGTADMCDPDNNSRSHYTDNQPHSGIQYQMAYDLCSMYGMQWTDFPIILDRMRERKIGLEMEQGRIPFRFGIEEFNRFLSEKSGSVVDITSMIEDAGLDADTEVPYTEQRGVDVAIQSVQYDPGYGIFAKVCNLGPDYTENLFDIYLTYTYPDEEVRGIGYMSNDVTFAPYECMDSQPALIPRRVIPEGTEFFPVNVFAFNLHERELNPDNNFVSVNVDLIDRRPSDTYVETVFGSTYTRPDHKGAVQAIVGFARDSQPFEYVWRVNGVDVKSDVYDPQGYNRVGIPPLWYPEETHGIDQGEEITLELIVDPNHRLPDENYDNNRFETTFVLPRR